MENRKEIIKGYFVGDIVMLEKETKITIKDKIQIGTIGTVSEGDNKKSLEGWVVIDLKKRFNTLFPYTTLFRSRKSVV